MRSRAQRRSASEHTHTQTQRHEASDNVEGPHRHKKWPTAARGIRRRLKTSNSCTTIAGWRGQGRQQKCTHGPTSRDTAEVTSAVLGPKDRR